MSGRTKRVLGEPLFHFLLIGVAIFGVHRWMSASRPVAAADGPRIEITAGVVERLNEMWQRQWKRPPTELELRGMVTDYIREEVLYREALALGLDKDDTIVRRRLAQKMEFLSENIAASAIPDDEAVQRYFERNAGRYARPARVSFRHVYFSRDRRGAGAEADARATLEALARGASEESIGDPFLGEYEFVARDEVTISAALGKEFAGRVMTLPVNKWRGPVASSYGVHLVHVSERGEPAPVSLAEVREQVIRDLNEERRTTANREVFERLKERYRVTVDESALSRAAAPAAKTAQATP